MIWWIVYSSFDLEIWNFYFDRQRDNEENALLIGPNGRFYFKNTYLLHLSRAIES